MACNQRSLEAIRLTCKFRPGGPGWKASGLHHGMACTRTPGCHVRQAAKAHRPQATEREICNHRPQGACAADERCAAVWSVVAAGSSVPCRKFRQSELARLVDEPARSRTPRLQRGETQVPPRVSHPTSGPHRQACGTAVGAWVGGACSHSEPSSPLADAARRSLSTCAVVQHGRRSRWSVLETK